MKNRTLRMPMKRATTLIAATAAIAITGSTLALAANNDSGTITACTRAGAVRIVDHWPCRRGETPLTWNTTGRDGQAGATGAAGIAGSNGTDGKDGPTGQNGSDGKNGADGKDGGAGRVGPAGAPGSAGTAGTNGHDGAAGEAGSPGKAGTDGLTGPAGPAGPQGAPGAAGHDGQAGPPGATGPAGPAGPAGQGGASTSAGGGFQFGRITNSTDPDCAMSAAIGHGAAGGCSLTPIKALGDFLPTAATLIGFVAQFDKTQSGGHVYAITIDSNARATDVLLLCTIPAGSSTCRQTAPINLTAERTLGLEFDGDRSWTAVSFGYQLTSR